MRDWIFALLLLAAAALIVIGVADWSAPAAWCVAGVSLAVWAYLVFVIGGAFAPTPKPASERVEAGS